MAVGDLCEWLQHPQAKKKRNGSPRCNPQTQVSVTDGRKKAWTNWSQVGCDLVRRILLLGVRGHVLAQELPDNIRALPLLEKYARRPRFVNRQCRNARSSGRERVGSISNE